MTNTIRLQVRPDANTVIVTGGTFANIGTGAEVYAGQSGNTAQFRRITGSGDTTVTQSGDSLVVFTIATGATVSWGNITGTLSDQTDLQNSLDALDSAITGNTDAINQNKTDILTNSAAISANTEAINTNTDNISGNTAALDNKLDISGGTITGTLVIEDETKIAKDSFPFLVIQNTADLASSAFGMQLQESGGTGIGEIVFIDFGDRHIKFESENEEVRIKSVNSEVKIQDLQYPKSDGIDGYVMQTNGAGELSLQPIQANNGLSLSGDNKTIILGGTLRESTNIFAQSGESMSIGGTTYDANQNISSFDVFSTGQQTFRSSLNSTDFAQLQFDNTQIKLTVETAGQQKGFVFDTTDFIVIDDQQGFGMRYNDDYSASGSTNDLWLPNWGYVREQITGNTQLIFELSGKTAHFDGKDTKANILALDPSLYLGENWFAEDTFEKFIAVTVGTTGNDEWIAEDIHYDAPTDTFKLDPTADGQVQNLGQEMFVNAYNVGTSGTTASIPKVFLVTGVVGGNEDFGNAQFALSTDIARGSTYGVNTTEAQINDFFKMTTYGEIKDVDTSSWTVNTILYVSDSVEGELTDVAPASNPIAIGIVRKQDAVNGILFVNTIRQVSEATDVIPVSFNYAFFSADIATGITGTNQYFIYPNNFRGVANELISTQGVNDNTRADLDDEWVTPPALANTTFGAGLYDAQIVTEISTSSANERMYIEIYAADTGGTVYDSGISGQTTGFTYPVRPVTQLQSSLLNLNDDFTYDVFLSGNLLDDFTLPEGNRFRVTVSVEKVGTAGGNKTFTCFFGTDYNSFIRLPFNPRLNDLADVNADGAVQNDLLKYNSANQTWNASTLQWGEITGTLSAQTDLQTEIDTKVEWFNVWTGGTYQKNSMVRDGSYTMIANKETSDKPAPVATDEKQWKSGFVITPPWQQLSPTAEQVIVGQRYTWERDGFVYQARFWVVANTDYSYEMWLVDNPTTNPSYTLILPEFTPDPSEEDRWLTFPVGENLFLSGRTYDLVMIIRSGSAPTSFAYDWQYERKNGNPDSGKAWHQSSGDELRIHQNDEGDTNRSSDLDNIDEGSQISAGGITWDVTSASKSGSVYTFGVLPANRAQENDYTISFTYYAPIPIEYDYIPDYYTGDTEVQGLIAVDAGYPDGITLNENAYGVDVEFSDAIISDDWDLVASSDDTGTGGGETVWGSITGTLSNQTDLQAALDNKPEISSEDTLAGQMQLAVVSALPGTPDSSTIYFITT